MVGDKVAEPYADVKGLLMGGADGAMIPEFAQGFDESLVVLALDDGCSLGPVLLWDAGVVELPRGGFGDGVLDGEGDVGGPEPGGAEAHGGLVEQLVGHGVGAFGRAEFGREDVALTDGFVVFEGGVVEVFTAEPVPEFFSVDGAPGAVHGFAVEGEELIHGADAGGVEALFHACADAGQVAGRELAECGVEDVWRKGDEAVGLVHVRGDFGEVAVGCEADGAAEGVSGMGADGGFDVAGKLEGVQERLLATDEAAGHFVDGADGGDGDAALDGLDDAVVVVDIDIVTGLDEGDRRAESAGFRNLGAGADAACLGLVGGGDGTGGVRHDGNDGDGAVAEVGAELLFDGGEVGVEVEEEPVETGVGGEWRFHEGIFAFYLPKSQRDFPV